MIIQSIIFPAPGFSRKATVKTILKQLEYVTNKAHIAMQVCFKFKTALYLDILAP